MASLDTQERFEMDVGAPEDSRPFCHTALTVLMRRILEGKEEAVKTAQRDAGRRAMQEIYEQDLAAMRAEAGDAAAPGGQLSDN